MLQIQTTINVQTPNADPTDKPAPAELKIKLEIEKLTLERNKLQVELHELGKSWWKRPAYLALMIPLALGGAGVIQGFRSGYFDLQKQRLDLAADRQALREIRIESQAKGLSKREEENTQLSQRLTAEREKLISEATAEREKHAKQLADIRQEFEREKEQLTIANQEVLVLQYLDNLKKAWRAQVSTEYSQGLIRLLQIKDQFSERRLAVVKAALSESAGDWDCQSTLLYILFQGSGDAGWREKLFSIVEDTLIRQKFEKYGPNSSTGVLEGLSHSWWAEEQRDEVALFTVRLLQKAPEEAVPDILWVYFSLSTAGRGLSSFRRGFPTEYLTAVQFARDNYLQSNSAHGSSGPALRALSPQLFLVVVSQLLLTERAATDQVFAAGLLQNIEYLSSGDTILDEATVPRTLDRAEWIAWREKNQKLVEYWSESGLETFHRNHALLEEAMVAWQRSRTDFP